VGLKAIILPGFPQHANYEPEKLSRRHREIIRLANLGMQPSAIAEELGVSRHTVMYTMRSELGREATQHLQDTADGEVQDIQKMLQELQPKAVKVLEEILDGNKANLALKFRAAESTLDRGGNGKITKVQGDFHHRGYIGGTVGIEVFKERAAAAMRKPVEVIEDAEEANALCPKGQETEPGQTEGEEG
jgi:hypothetical protein